MILTPSMKAGVCSVAFCDLAPLPAFALPPAEPGFVSGRSSQRLRNSTSLPLKAARDQMPDRRGAGFDSLALGPGFDGLFDLLRQPNGKNVRGLLFDPRAT